MSEVIASRLFAITEAVDELSNVTDKVVPLANRSTGIGWNTSLTFARDGARRIIDERARR